MKRFPRRPRALSLVTCFLMFAALSARAAEIPPPRAFAPVQLGFQPNAPIVPAHVEGRVLVKLTESAVRASKLPSNLRPLQAVPDAKTGLATVDKILSDGGAKLLQKSFIEARNTVEAKRLGLDRWLRVDLGPGASAIDAADRLSRLPEVEAVSLDYIAFPDVVPSDPMHASHWGHNNTAQLLSYNWTNHNHETGSPVS